MCSSFYLIEMCVLSSGESKAALLGLEGQEAGQQSLSNLQVIAIESGGCLGDVTELVGKLLLHDGVQLCLITLQRIKLNIQTPTKHEKANIPAFYATPLLHVYRQILYCIEVLYCIVLLVYLKLLTHINFISVCKPQNCNSVLHNKVTDKRSNKLEALVSEQGVLTTFLDWFSC